MAKNKRGPKERIWTEVETTLVRYMAMAGVPHKRIAERLNTTAGTLREKFRAELDHGRDDVKALLMGQLVKKIKEGNVPCIIFASKTILGLRETTNIEHSGGIATTPVLCIVSDDDAKREQEQKDENIH